MWYSGSVEDKSSLIRDVSAPLAKKVTVAGSNLTCLRRPQPKADGRGPLTLLSDSSSFITCKCKILKEVQALWLQQLFFLMHGTV